MRLWESAVRSVWAVDDSFRERRETPVFTVNGRYVPQGWTEWTQGFQFGCGFMVFDAIGDRRTLEIAQQGTMHRMAEHVSHTGVHDHGFNNVSTFGHLRRLVRDGRVEGGPGLVDYCEMALRVSGAVQAARWSSTNDNSGYIYSFNGPHSLFSDTIRSLRSLALAHQLGHVLWSENDVRISLLDRLCQHALTTAKYNVYYGEGRDIYDVVGRVAHESIFNTNDGRFRCPSSQQGYSPFSTWTRGLAWIMLGYAEQIEFFDSLNGPSGDTHLAAEGSSEVSQPGTRSGEFSNLSDVMLKAACASSDFYIAHTSLDGIPYWDTGAPGLVHLPDYQNQVADPLNPYEPVDSSAAAIAAQGLLRLGEALVRRGDSERGQRYRQAGLTTARTLLAEPYLNTDPAHQGILLHVVYHRPRGWDYVPAGRVTPCGESALWGDYHLLELGLYLQRMASGGPYYAFFDRGV